MVLNGFAEFIRNLLVCKDEKTAGLMEAVDAFKEKYIATAKTVDPAFLISALNILNDSELSYKAARNKRLHVELALIKLCYLQQALELSVDTNGVSKKKIVDKAKSLAFRSIAPVEIKKPGVGNQDPITIGTGISRKNKEAKLTIETSQRELSIVEEPGSGNQQPETGNQRLAALNKIRSQFKNTANGDKSIPANPLEMESLQKSWNEFAQFLKEQKNAAGQNFEMATLYIVDANSFYAKASNNIQFRFIDSNGLKVTDFLKEKLQNNLLKFFVVLEENKELHPKMDAPLTAREQFQKMTEQYPLVKELKDRLGLELDY